MKDPIYMEGIESCYIREYETKVKEVDENDRISVILYETPFYPTGGGQPNDTGRLYWKGGEARIVDVVKKNKIIHFIEGDVPRVGTKVIAELDWERRYSHMKMHTAQHLISSVMWDLYQAVTVGNQIYDDRSHIDFYPADFPAEEVPKIEEKVNELITGAIPVNIVFKERKLIESTIEKERMDLSRLPSSVKELRIVNIGENGSIDICPCAGTHVKNLSELGRMRIIKRKSKGAGKIRLTYVLE
jgi:misacylated tRNA(Ala) deacylase